MKTFSVRFCIEFSWYAFSLSLFDLLAQIKYSAIIRFGTDFGLNFSVNNARSMAPKRPHQLPTFLLLRDHQHPIERHECWRCLRPKEVHLQLSHCGYNTFHSTVCCSRWSYISFIHTYCIVLTAE